jgi:DUF3014 family protein
MSDAPDYDIYRTPVESADPPPGRTRAAGVWIAVALFVVAAGTAAYFAFRWRPAPPSAPAASAPAATLNEPLPSLGGKPEPIAVPPLDQSDTLVRTLVQKISESPAIMAWLPTQGLIRNFTVVVSNIAEGATPAKQLRVLRPTSGFRVVERDGGTFVDPRGYDRYTRIADAVASIDPAAAATLYATLKPRIEEAYRDLGAPNGSFDRTLQRAIAELVETPIVDPSPRLRPKGIGYAYADERLENLTAAQRQLLRMGPRNVRVIQSRLREIALALGIPQSAIRNQ